MDIYLVTDTETTGLKPGHILEIASIAINRDLEVLGTPFEKVIRPTRWGDSSFFEFECEPIALEMHKNNGLMSDVQEKGVHPDVAHMHFYHWIERIKREHLGGATNGDGGKIYLMGNTLGGVDLPFLRRHMPDIFKLVHYRYVDISSFRVTLEMFTGKDFRYNKEGKGAAHRAMADALNCIEEARYIWRELRGHLA